MSAQNLLSHDGEHKRQKIIDVNKHDDLCDNVLIRLSVNIQEKIETDGKTFIPITK